MLVARRSLEKNRTTLELQNTEALNRLSEFSLRNDGRHSIPELNSSLA